ncbi:MAG TPA: hypothetical protein PLI95_18730 [Polyangiaceae bacterium]|nr:hypothetical protein [Polyangiaceae bacterium]
MTRSLRVVPSLLTAALTAAALFLVGCPKGMCLVKVCKGNTGNCSCSWSTCPKGSTYDTNRNTCVCEAGRVSLGGSCLTPAEANQYCGKGNHWEPQGCVRTVCPAGQEVNLDTGACMAKQQVDQVAQNMGVAVGQDQKLGCPPGLVLVVEGSQAASCVPKEQTCTRDEVWNGQACVKTAQCPPGSVFDPATAACIAYASGEGKEEFSVDLAQWVTSSYGPDGGAGTQAFCSGFNKKPMTFGVTPGGSIRVVATVGVQAAGGNVSNAVVTTSGVVQASNAPVTTKGAAEIQRAAEEILATLKNQGGKSQKDYAGARVSCVIVNAAQPTAVPATGGI